MKWVINEPVLSLYCELSHWLHAEKSPVLLNWMAVAAVWWTPDTSKHCVCVCVYRQCLLCAVVFSCWDGSVVKHKSKWKWHRGGLSHSSHGCYAQALTRERFVWIFTAKHGHQMQVLLLNKLEPKFALQMIFRIII